MKEFIKIVLILAIVSLLLSISCEQSTEPGEDLNFQKLEIHYSKMGGWIQPTKLDIYGNGLVKANLLNHSNHAATDSASKILTKKEQDEIVNLFRSFSEYKRHYEPENWVTDQNTHSIVFINDGIPDTVSVYMPEKADIPLNLMKTILGMESLWASMLED